MVEKNVTPGGVGLPFRGRTVLIAVVVVAAVILLLSSFFVVNQTEQAVVLQFGKYSRVVGPGLHFKIPFGIQRNYNVPTQVIQTLSFGYRTERPGITTVYSPGEYPQESVMLTGDLNIVNVEWVIQYRIVDPRAWLFNVANREKTIRDISQSVVNQLVGDRAILGVLGPERLSIETDAQQMMNTIFESYGFGIRVTTVKLQNIVPPKGDVQNAFEDVNKAVQDMNRFINEGKEQYNTEIPKAQGQAKQVVQQAQGYAAERVNRAEGDVARFQSVLAEYEKNKTVTRDRLYIEMVEEVFGKGERTELIDKNLQNFIPLKTMGSQPAAASGRTGGNQ